MTNPTDTAPRERVEKLLAQLGGHADYATFPTEDVRALLRQNEDLVRGADDYRDRIKLEMKMVQEESDRADAAEAKVASLTLALEKAREKLEPLVSEGVFSQQRFAEDTDAGYFLRCAASTKARIVGALSAVEAALGEEKQDYSSSQDAVVASPLNSAVSSALDALRGMLQLWEDNTCAHEDRHRGGYIWTICDQCGRKWADDQGGYQPDPIPEAVEFARRVLSAPPAETACEVEGWRPIETAPKDGTRVLLWSPEAAGIWWGYWWRSGDAWMNTDTGEDGWTNGFLDTLGELRTFAPTHWRPLPPPPSDSALVRQDGTAERDPSNQQQGEGK